MNITSLGIAMINTPQRYNRTILLPVGLNSLVENIELVSPSHSAQSLVAVAVAVAVAETVESHLAVLQLAPAAPQAPRSRSMQRMMSVSTRSVICPPGGYTVNDCCCSDDRGLCCFQIHSCDSSHLGGSLTNLSS
ncbi:hypothetical protein PoB_003740700 [Plakobranchus ocellatus]|uniref:Granulins domain-containing protein n=1 Tax=Plakobranchus ocellatus TaxID=259542 RepID=A0AAV4AV66_9GAST|nr:hypothetical protein PoB_003740700 [Plakobranchus ocellatus]